MDEADTSDWPDAPCRRGRKQGKARGLGPGSGVHPVSLSLSLLPGPAACGTLGVGEVGRWGMWGVWASDGGHLGQSNT